MRGLVALGSVAALLIAAFPGVELDPAVFRPTSGDGWPHDVAVALHEQGWQVGPDRDRDGIPDAWEEADFGWGPWSPSPSTRDLPVELLLMEDSHRIHTVNLVPVVSKLQEFFLSNGWHLDAHVTSTSSAWRPGPLTPNDRPDAMNHVPSGRNPYVYTVALVPGMQQSAFQAWDGAAFQGGRFAVVDHSAATTYWFDGTAWPGNLESFILAGHAAMTKNLGFTATSADGNHLTATRNNTTWSWSGPAYRTAPTNGSEATLEGIDLDVDRLAGTILHELGHLLGLCHVNRPSCAAMLPDEEQASLSSSTMHGDAPSGTMYWSPTQWATAADTLACPPDVLAFVTGTDPIRAEIATSFEGPVPQRSCPRDGR